jgi:hypothetical protein
METPDPQFPVEQPVVPAARRRFSGPRRAIATTLLSVGMMAIGGVAIVNAASPAPAASAPAAGAPAAGGSGTPHTPPANGANCPNM